jgi:ABC-type nitrate/sulfonate/bicarbonate transport system substrate-binding protein
MAALLFPAVGCASRSSGNAAFTSSDALEEPGITIAAVPRWILARVYITEDDGFFAQHGLHVNLVMIAASKAIIADQMAGKIDLYARAYMPCISAMPCISVQAAGARFRILTSVAELVGKTIGMRIGLAVDGTC